MTDGKWNVNTDSGGQAEYTGKDYKVSRTDEGWTAFHRETPTASWDAPLSAMAYCELLDLQFSDQ